MENGPRPEDMSTNKSEMSDKMKETKEVKSKTRMRRKATDIPAGRKEAVIKKRISKSYKNGVIMWIHSYNISPKNKNIVIFTDA